MPGRRGQGERVNRVPPWSLPLFLVVCLAAFLIGGWLRSSSVPEWQPNPATHSPRPWAVEADCYSQLARVQRILHGQGLIQNHFTVENWPEGLTPSTTATFDYAILALYVPCTLFTKYPLDWAGALISPVLWLGVCLFWIFFRSRAFTRAGRATLIVAISLIPPLIWATAFGRPRHQSLIVALLAVAFTLEYERWENGARKGLHIAAGIVWGLACWTSLYEPLFAIIALVVFNLIARRKENAAFAISFGAVMLLALLLEGVHVFIPPPEYRAVLERWLQFIVEMRGMNTFEMAMGLPVSMILIVIACWMGMTRKGNKVDILLIVLTVLLSLFALFQKRWLNYACLTEIFLLARFFQTTPLHWSRLLLGAIFLVDVGHANFLKLKDGRGLPPNQPSAEMAQLTRSIDAPGGIMAPWWISPGLLYFSGQPIVSGSSHCGISGIQASAQFFASTSWVEAEKILRDRKVRWIVVWDERKYVYPLLDSSQEILAEPISSDENKGDADATVAQVLVTDHQIPTDLQLRAVTDHLKLYEFMGN